METIKNIAAIIGVILSTASLITLCSKPVKKFIASLFKKYGNDSDIEELKKAFERLSDSMNTHIETTENLIKVINENSNISIEFTKQQCRNIIKQIFYRYYESKTLPLYEHKTLMSIKDIYINQCHGNSYAQEMLDIMSSWSIDYTQSCLDED